MAVTAWIAHHAPQLVMPVFLLIVVWPHGKRTHQ